VSSPVYTVRRSLRARRVTLRVTPEHGVVVVVPPRFDLERVPAIVRENAAWIDRAAKRVGLMRAAPGSRPLALPARIVLPAVGEEWGVRYVSTAAAGVRVAETAAAGGDPGPVAGLLTLRGAVDDDAACRAALQRWLARRARAALVPLADDLARRLGYSYTRLTVRNQRTRWGSCSRRGTISLNCQLLFVSPESVRYVVVHELCHTVHFDHSLRFWALVRRHEPACDRLRGEVRLAKQAVPGWASASPSGAGV
jgi:predicted metal-dependent hydrolase